MDPAARTAALLEAEAAGRAPTCLPFWGRRPQPDGSIGPGCLSQWWPSAFTVGGVRYATAEHWMIAAKARLFGDHVALGQVLAALGQVLAAGSPGAAKAAGRQVRGFDDTVRAAGRCALVVDGKVAKFAAHDLAAFLRRTGTRVLVEASPHDRISGVGLAPTDPGAHRPSQWRGLNLLGFALMEVRERLCDG